MKKRILTNLMLFLLSLCVGACGTANETEKIHANRSRIVNVQSRISDIHTEVVIANPLLYVLDNVLIVLDMKPSSNKGIHLFDKKTFQHLASTGILGHGPGEIVRYGRLGIDPVNRVFWVPDHGKQQLMKFPLDSVLLDPNFKPSTSLSLLNELFIERFGFLNDSTALGKAVHVLSSSSYQMVMAKLNIRTNEISKYGYEQPEATSKKSNSFFAMSVSNNIYVNAYAYCDLITICDLDGNLICNVFGPDRTENKDFRNAYYTGVDFLDQFVIASYIGKEGIVTNEFQRQVGNLPTQLHVFDKNGNYVTTFEGKHKFSSFCVDEENKRVIAYYSDRINPLGYFSIDDEDLIAK